MNSRPRSAPPPAGEDPEPAGRDPQPVSRNPQPAGEDPEPAGRDPQPVSQNPQPVSPDPQPDVAASLPVMPGFREMAMRRSADEADEQDEQLAEMAERRGRLVRELAKRRQAAGLSQTEVAARMRTSQSAVARLESGTADVRASTLERYAAAVGGQITWKLNRPGEGASE